MATSKKRRAARAWMTAERARSERDSIQSAERARQRCDREWRARLTAVIPPDDEGTVYPQGRLDKMYIMVLAPDREAIAMTLDERGYIQANVMQQLPDAIRVTAKQMAHVLPNGAKLVWWTWEVR